VKLIATICARGGSKGVPGKHLREVAGKPLIAHTIEQALKSQTFDAVAVSSDDDAILDAASSFGATHLIKRPPELATDSSAKLPAVRHCVLHVESRQHKFDVVVDLDATSPLRISEDITSCLALFRTTECSNVITGCVSRRSPYFNMVEVDADGTVHLVKSQTPTPRRRQDTPPTFDMNASIYVWRRDALFDSDDVIRPQTRLYVMPEERSLDIDSELDFEMVSYLMVRQQR
jgi:CMP-N,N'-diacetyllegionaminic acid synthase